jgi:hypothetical protein
MGELKPVWPDAPRKAPGIRLPAYRYVPGHAPRPEERSYDDPFAAGVDLYHLGYLWEAHEAWEVEYHRSDDREFLQGLIQIAAMLLKAHLGNEKGVHKLYRKSRANLEGLSACRGVNVPGLVAQLDRWYRTRGAPPRIQ